MTHTCDKPDDCRILHGDTVRSLVYYRPVYDGHGNNLNPDRNTTWTNKRCLTCGKEWTEET